MADYAGEQEMEIEALRAILMDDFEDADADSVSGFRSSSAGTSTSTSAPCGPWYKITISPKGDDEDEPTEVPVRLGLFFAHTAKYPDEKPCLLLRSLQGVRQADLEEIQGKVEEEAEQNLGMAMIFTLATSAKEWLREKYGQPAEEEAADEDEDKEEVIEAHGLPVTLESFMEWRERFEAEQALERAKLMPDSALATKERRLSGREWFVQRALKGAGVEVVEAEEDAEDEDVDFEDDFEDEDIDEDELLQHYLDEKGEKA